LNALALIDYTLYGKRDKVKIAIERIKMFCPVTNGYDDAPYYVAYSGGKDSDALRILFDLSGVPYDLVHNHTTVDAPETVYYIRSIPKIQISYPNITMWELIVKKRMPPTRIARYCCEHLKERGGKGRTVATGVRWSESVKRKVNRGSLEIIQRRGKHLIMNADNADDRQLFENCITKGKRVLNPIVDWTDTDVWEFLKHYGCRSNPLYECGYKRVGCIGCPMVRGNKLIEELNKYPRYKAAYIKAFDKMVLARIKDGLPTQRWATGQDVYNWWTTRTPKNDDPQSIQINLFEMGELHDLYS
jgi:phosphoadenosine phosphosulfate reductase